MKYLPLALAGLLSFVSPVLAHDLPIPHSHEHVRGRPTDALDVLNAQRAKRGLPPYQRDPGLTDGAFAVSKYRADRRIHGHTRNDFGFLPKGVHAPVAGCAAWDPGTGFGACEAYSRRYRYAGAAWCLGVDGKVYCHLFVR